MTNPTGAKSIHRVTLRDKATTNHALDSYAYGRMPHLFFVLANKYDVPPSLLLAVFFLWDRTVGTDDSGCGDCALTQIPLRRQEKVKWLEALVAANFFERVKSKSGGANQSGSFYAYQNPTADEWDEFFRRAEILQRFPNWDGAKTEKFGQLFSDIRSDDRLSSRAAYFAFLELLGRGQQRKA
jgi:hypothetical protein